MYEANQRRVESQYETSYKLPVLYYPQVLGLAMGFSLEEMGFKLNRIKSRKLMKALQVGA
jgi:heterodisulfide reductase subunit B